MWGWCREEADPALYIYIIRRACIIRTHIHIHTYMYITFYLLKRRYLVHPLLHLFQRGRQACGDGVQAIAAAVACRQAPYLIVWVGLGFVHVFKCVVLLYTYIYIIDIECVYTYNH
jgi:hypothetical protein